MSTVYQGGRAAGGPSCGSGGGSAAPIKHLLKTNLGSTKIYLKSMSNLLKPIKSIFKTYNNLLNTYLESTKIY